MTILFNRPLSEDHVTTLANLINNDQLVLFVGAGLSLQAVSKNSANERLPLWNELANKVAKDFNMLEESRHYDLFQLFNLIETNNTRHDLEEAVRKAIPQENFEPSTAHHELCSNNWNMIVTTNYDDLLVRTIPENSPIVTESDFDWLTRGNKPKLIHIHGTLNNPHTLTGFDYGLWSEKHPRAFAYLQDILLNKTILFVGYSLSDPYLRFYLLPWLNKITNSRGKRHYAWMWNINEKNIKLYDKCHCISVVSIDKNEDWAYAFRQLKEISNSLLTTSKLNLKKIPTLPKKDVDNQAIINGYKLFYYRSHLNKKISLLSKEVDISSSKLNELEQVKTKTESGPNCFATISRDELARIEKSLNCIGKLEYGQSDDFLAKYIMYYKCHKNLQLKNKSIKKSLFLPDTKAVIFDFGGTLTLTSSNRSTWEKMWESVGYTIQDAGNYHRKYLSREITHQQWCDITADKLRNKNFSKQHLCSIIKGIEPIAGLQETISTLRNQGTSIYIVSGSIREIITSVLGESFSLFSEVKANEILFDSENIIKSIKGTPFDFQGKAKFIERVIKELNCEPLDVLFIGNSLNDMWACNSGVRTLCVNPVDVDFTNNSIWTDYIKNMENLKEILAFTKRV